MPEMNQAQFMAWAIESIKSFLPESYRKAEIDVVPLAKTGVTYTAMTVRQKDQTTVPAINLEEMFDAYQNDVPLPVIGARMAQIVQTESPVYDTSIFASYESIKKNLFIRVCGIDDNKIMLGTVPYKKVENLAITYHIMVKVGDEGMSSAMITKDMLESFNISSDQLYEDALKNSQVILPAKVDTMMNMLFGAADIEMDSMGMPGQPPMVVVTNRLGINGASALFYPGVMDKVAETLHDDYYVLPSSIHEVIAIPVSLGSNYRDLERMVREVNEMAVAPEDQLSNSVYRYDSKAKIFEMAATQAQRERVARHKAREMER